MDWVSLSVGELVTGEVPIEDENQYTKINKIYDVDAFYVDATNSFKNKQKNSTR